MPNHCYQQVHIQGPNFLVRELWEGLTGNGYNPQNNGCAKNPQFCQLVVPMPFEQWISPRTKWRGYDVEGWYDWRVNNWGTKWDVVDVQLTNEIEDDEEKSSFSFNCWTAWGPPTPVWDKLHNMGISVHATYQDEGGMFEGEYIDGKDNTWEPEFEEEEEAHAV